MKLERLHEYILPFVVIVVAMALAIYIGHLSGDGQTSTLALVLAALIVATALLVMRENIWIIIPICWVLSGQISVLPLPFSVSDLAIFTVFVCFLILKATKIVRIKPIMTDTDRWMIAMLLYLATVFIRNPVGVQALGAEKVGGRPYFEVAVAFLAYWVLARSFLSPQQSRFLPLWIFGSRMIDGVLKLITFEFPATAPILSDFYSGVDMGAYNATDIRTLPSGESVGRLTYLTGPGTGGVLLACGYWRPLTVINPIYFWRFLLFSASFIAVLLTGFRSGVMGSVIAVVISSYLRRGFSELLPLVMIGVPALALGIAMQGTLIDLPIPAQRALSFLPGRWDANAKAEAEASTEWRIYMWKAMLTEDKYIQNKWFGDGFGFTQHEFETIMVGQFSRDARVQQENFLITGGVHSGPISTIRYVGFVGLAIFIVTLCLIARDAFRLARRALTTPYLPFALFIGIPIIWEPVNFLFIFGSFDANLPSALFSLGLLKMLKNSLDKYELEKSTEVELPPPSAREERAGTRPALAHTGPSAAF